MTKQLRIPFPDYTAKQQERDTQHSLLRTVYLMKIDGEWGHLFITQRGDDIDFYPGKDLSETYKALKQEYPNCQPRVIQNPYLEEYLRTKRPEIMKLKHPQHQHKSNAHQLSIPWSNEK